MILSWACKSIHHLPTQPSPQGFLEKPYVSSASADSNTLLMDPTDRRFGEEHSGNNRNSSGKAAVPGSRRILGNPSPSQLTSGFPLYRKEQS